MSKYVTDEAMRSAMTLQKGYIDQGDSNNAEGIDSLKAGKNLLTGVITGNSQGPDANWGSSLEVSIGATKHPIVAKDGKFSINKESYPDDLYLVSPLVRVEEGKTYTFSIYVSEFAAYEIRVVGNNNNLAYQGVGGGGAYLTYTFTPEVTGYVRIFIGGGHTRWSRPQLELSSARTEFTASTEELKEYHDMDTKKISEDIKEISDKVDLLLLSAPGLVAKYSKGSNDYTEISHKGQEGIQQKDILNKFGFVLLDTTDNANTTTKAKRLKDNNLFRFEDGSFAPTVGITTDQYNQCMANDVYTEESGTYTKVYDAGAFDAAAQWETDKALIKAGNQAQNLYISDGNGGYQLVTHVLRPWETTETKYTIGIANLVDMYLFDNQIGNSGDYLKGLFFGPVVWDGIDLTKRRLQPTAISPGPVTTIEEGGKVKTRNFFYLYQGMGKCQSGPGLLPNHDFYEADRTYPRCDNMPYTDFRQLARNNNADNSKPYPFAEGGYFATNVFITALELAAGTRYIHQANLFGSGISDNDGCNAENFFTSGGVRLKKVADTDWYYKRFGESSKPLSIKATSWSDPLISEVLTSRLVMEQCMESQMAASMATELGINPTIDPSNPNYFQFYGNTYYYMNVPGFDGLQEGRMNARVYKYTSKTVSAFSDRVATDFNMEVIYRMSLFNGANLCGDLSVYKGGGLEMLVIKDPAYSQNYPIDIYIEPDQTKWHSDNTPYVNIGQTFGFETSYEKVISTSIPGSSEYILTRGGYTPFGAEIASTMAQGECYMQHIDTYYSTKNAKTRQMPRFGGFFESTYCSPRGFDTDSVSSYLGSFSKAVSSQALVVIEL